MGSITPLENKPQNKCRYWRLFVSCGKDRRGKRIQKSRRFRGTYGEAKKALAEFEAECANAVSEEIKLGVYLNRWYEKRIGKMKASTLAKDRQAMRTIKWLFGEDTRLSEFEPSMIDEAFRELMETGGPAGRPVRSSYAGHLKSSLYSMLKSARIDGYLSHDPMEGTEHIVKKSKERDDIPSAAEVKALLDGLDCRDGHQMCVFLCASLGLRRAEALALQWKNVDFEKGLVHIKTSLQYGGELGEPKTAESRRTLPMPDYLREALQTRLAAAKADVRVSLARGDISKEPDWNEVVVCCNEKGAILSSSAASHWWDKHRSIYGIKCGLHGLRHALLTTLAEQNVHPKVMQAVAGHASAAFCLNVYTHTNMNDKENAFTAIHDVLAPSEGGDEDAED